MIMESIEEFLAYAVKLEQEAALRFGQLADAMATAGNREVMELFRRLSEYSRLHMIDARARAGFRELPDLKSADFQWPDMESPETAAIWAADPLIGREQALQVALEAERAVWPTTRASWTPQRIRKSQRWPRNSSKKRRCM